MTAPYHKYVFSLEEQRFRGDFDEMYKNEDKEGFDSWFQDDVTHPVRQIALALLDRYNFARVLDVGCGKGTFTHLLKKHNNQVKGLDVSPSALAKARARYPAIEYEERDLNRIETLGPDRFDLTVAMAVLYYLENRRGVLRAIAGVSDRFFTTLYIPPQTLGFIKNIDEFLEEAARHFDGETEVVLNRHTLIWLGRSKG
jgi:SAM-dependent methyltransferase